MFGPNVDACSPDGAPDEQRGLVPRVLEYLFAHVAREERRNGGSVKYLCRCSFYEIFNERVFDLLDAGCSLGGLQVRQLVKAPALAPCFFCIRLSAAALCCPLNPFVSHGRRART